MGSTGFAECKVFVGGTRSTTDAILTGSSTRALRAADAAIVVASQQVHAVSAAVRIPSWAGTLTVLADQGAAADRPTEAAVVLAGHHVHAGIATGAKPRGAGDDAGALRTARRAAAAAIVAASTIRVAGQQVHAGTATTRTLAAAGADGITDRATADTVDAGCSLGASIVATTAIVGVS
jgi:hypothetical protein